MGLRAWIKRNLTRRRTLEVQGRRRKVIVEEEEPDDLLVNFILFASIVTVALSAVQVAYLLVLGEWNDGVFALISGLTGTVTGIIIGRKR